MTATAPAPPSLSFPRATFAKLSPHPYLLAHLQPQSSPSSSSSSSASASPSTSSTAAPRRANGRLPAQSRTPHINTSSLAHAHGSAVVRLGDTTVVCGIRGEILSASNIGSQRLQQQRQRSTPEGEGESEGANPRASAASREAQELDLLVPNVELATGCAPAFLPGQPPGVLAQSLSTRIYLLLHSSGLVDGEDLRIWYRPEKIAGPGDDDDDDDDDEGEEEKEGGEEEEGEGEEEEEGSNDAAGLTAPEIKAFWTLYIDILFISLDGNPFDAAWAAVVAALRDLRLPAAYWDPDHEMILCSPDVERSRRLRLRGLPIASTYVVFGARERAGGEKEEEGQEGQEEEEEEEEETQEQAARHWVLADPDAFEEGLCDESVTVTLDCSGRDTRILGISKGGGTVVGGGGGRRRRQGEVRMREVVGMAEGRWREWVAVLLLESAAAATATSTATGKSR